MKLALILIISLCPLLFSQTFWQKNPANPVLQIGEPGFWDANSVYASSVLFDGSNFKMYYAGYNGFNYQIGLATSADKINWIRHADIPVLEYGMPGTWDARYVSQPSVIFENGIYKMWYTGWTGGGLENFKIGYAISANGISWDKYDFNPVFSASTIGNWDPLGVFSPTVIFINGVYHMWFTGHDGTKRAIGYATSVDGINWNWYQGNPVLVGEPGNWDEELGHCEVLRIGENFLMWYSGFNADTSAIGYAHSSEGINWNKYSGNPVLTAEPNTWEQLAVDEPNVFYDSTYLHMWYSGFSSENHSQIGLASEITIDVNNNTFAFPAKFILYQNHPNPFNPTTNIGFRIAERGFVTLKIYDVLGNEIATLVKEELLAGEYEVTFDSASSIENPASGIYFYQLQAGEFVQAKKMVLIK